LLPQKRKAWFSGRALLTAIYQREELPLARKMQGAAIVTEYSATTIIPPRARFFVDQAGDLIVELH
jgi:N-methylhydantoinase A